MRKRRHHRDSSILLGALALSAFLHLLFQQPLQDALFAFMSAGKKPDSKVKMVQLSSSAYAERQAAIRQAVAQQVESKPAEKKPKAEEKPKPESKLSGQIVEVPPTADDRQDPNAKFLSKYNTRVKKESVARIEERDSSLKRVTNKLQRKQVAPPKPGAVMTPGISAPGKAGAGKKSAAKKGDTTGKGRFTLEMPDLKGKDEIQLSLLDQPGRPLSNQSGSETVKGNSDAFKFEIGLGQKDGQDDGDLNKKQQNALGKNGLPTLSAFAPMPGASGAFNGSPSRDHIEGVEQGSATFLNTKEFRYATFFYRVRDSVASHWEDLAAHEYRRRDPTGNIYGVRDRATLLSIQLTPSGSLRDVRVQETSGVGFLDTVAIQAFRMAQPFPNPPEGIRDEDGMIRFNFQFVVTMRPRSPLNLFR